MSQTIKLTDLDKGALAAIADGGVDVTMRITIANFESARKVLGAIMEKEPSHRRTKWEEDGHTEEELQLLCGLFDAVTRLLPMGADNFIEWLRLTWPERLDDFIMWRLRQMEDDQLRDALAYGLRDRNLDALGLERIDEPVSEARKRRKSGSGGTSDKVN